MKFEFIEKDIDKISADVEIIFIVEKNFDHKWVKDKEELELLNFKGEDEESALLADKRRLYVGVKSLDSDDIRVASAKAIKTIKNKNFKSAKIGIYSDVNAAVEGIMLGNYQFNSYKSKKEKSKLKTIYISQEEYSNKEFDSVKIKQDIEEAKIVANSTNYVRDLVNTPPNEITPVTLAKVAKLLAKEKDLEYKVLDENDLEKEGMNAFLAVGKASANPPRLIHLTYKPKNPKAKVALVGKGLTYDSGGLSLKPSEYMVTMKSDKSGACAVLGIIKAAKELELPIQIDAIIGAAENMVGPNSYKPDDILKAKNGKTIEVRNTDAEGRLVLADSLCYAQEKVKPDFILDFATLTGACVVALGEYTTGVMGFNSSLKKKILEATKESGELASELPFNRYLPKLLKSQVADICNISSSRYGGAITAALFLSEFIEEDYKDRWVHLDIAGPAYVEKEWGYNPYGASGAGVRLAIKWLQKEFNK